MSPRQLPVLFCCAATLTTSSLWAAPADTLRPRAAANETQEARDKIKAALETDAPAPTTAGTPDADTTDTAALITQLEQDAMPARMEDIALRQRRLVRFLRTVYALLHARGLLDDQTIFYPAIGLDGFLAAHAPVVALDISDIVVSIFPTLLEDLQMSAAEAQTMMSQIHYPEGIDPWQVDRYPWRMGTTAHKTIIAKGWGLFKSA